MTTITERTPLANGPPADVPSEPIWRLTVEQYHEMIRAGIITDDDPVELLEGWLVLKMGRNPPHRACVAIIREALANRLPSGWSIFTQDPITTATSEPEPDISIVRGGPRDYIDRHPGPQDTAIVGEVADTSLRRDRGIKKRAYARAGIPIYWIINLQDRQVEIYTGPTAEPPDYRDRQDYRETDEVPVLIEGKEVGRIPVRELLP
jgi:Uma2 family endonuclease